MANVPDTTTFCFSPDVINAITPTPNDLVSAFANACPAGFDPAYCGAKNSLLNFQNYCGTPTPSFKCVDLSMYYDCNPNVCYWRKCACIVTNPAMSAGECFDICLCGNVSVDPADGGSTYAVAASCNSWLNVQATPGGTPCSQATDFQVCNGDNVTVEVATCTQNSLASSACLCITSITSLSGCFCLGSTCTSICTCTESSSACLMYLCDGTPACAFSGCARLCPNVGGIDCFNLTISYEFGQAGAVGCSGRAGIRITCNLTDLSNYYCLCTTPYDCSGSIGPFNVTSADVIYACVYARDLSGGAGTYATIGLSVISNCVGCYCIGSPAGVTRGAVP